MTKYVGIKIVSATPQERDGIEGYKVIYQDGYESWSPKEVFEESYCEFNYSNLTGTSKMMVSPDYKDRFRAEYLQLSIRIEGLSKMLKNYKDGTLAFIPACSYEMLDIQRQTMKNYKKILESRAEIENIELIK